MSKEHHDRKRRSKRSVALYLIILFSVAILFLVLAYFMQERAYAQAAALVLGMM